MTLAGRASGSTAATPTRSQKICQAKNGPTVGTDRSASSAVFLPHVAEAPAALYAYPWGRARADALWRRADAEEELSRVLEGDEGRALDW